MKTQNANKLFFEKNSIIELNYNQLNSVKGGGPTLTTISTSTYVCGAVGVSVALSEQIFDAGEAVGGMVSRLFK